MKPLLQHYKQLQLNDVLLQSECQRAKLSLTTGQSIIPRLYPNLQQNTASVHSYSRESFSCMRRIISNVRNSLTTAHASDFMFTSLNKDILNEIDINIVIEK